MNRIAVCLVLSGLDVGLPFPNPAGCKINSTPTQKMKLTGTDTQNEAIVNGWYIVIFKTTMTIPMVTVYIQTNVQNICACICFVEALRFTYATG